FSDVNRKLIGRWCTRVSTGDQPNHKLVNSRECGHLRMNSVDNAGSCTSSRQMLSANPCHLGECPFAVSLFVYNALANESIYMLAASKPTGYGPKDRTAGNAQIL